MLTRLLIAGLLSATTAPWIEQHSACKAPVWGDTVTAFETRVRAYVDLRNKLAEGLPRPVVTASLADIS